MSSLPRPVEQHPGEYCCGFEPEYAVLVQGFLYLVRCTYKPSHQYVGTLVNGKLTLTSDEDLTFSRDWIERE